MRSLIPILFLLQCTLAIRFLLQPNGKKCLKEEIHKNIVVTGEYEVAAAPEYAQSIHVIDTRGHTLYKRENFYDPKGKFAFTTDEYDIFEICISSHGPKNQIGEKREVFLEMKHGVEAKNYDEIAKIEKLKPLEMKLRRLEDLSNYVLKDFHYMRQHEEKMRSTNESTNSRILYLSIFSMFCLLCLTGWQIIFLRNYFKSKRLID